MPLIFIVQQPQPRFQTELSYVTYLFSEWRIQSLSISIPETLLHVTLKRRAEISADIFARLLRYFFLSCKNLTIKDNIFHWVTRPLQFSAILQGKR